jgi:hypothetical protein
LVSERIGTAKKYAEALDLAKRSVWNGFFL